MTTELTGSAYAASLREHNMAIGSLIYEKVREYERLSESIIKDARGMADYANAIAKDVETGLRTNESHASVRMVNLAEACQKRQRIADMMTELVWVFSETTGVDVKPYRLFEVGK